MFLPLRQLPELLLVMLTEVATDSLYKIGQLALVALVSATRLAILPQVTLLLRSGY